jgi:hypothetical protein
MKRTKLRSPLSPWALALAAAGCGDALVDQDGTTPPPSASSGKVDTEADTGDAFLTVVDATASEAWVHVSLANGGVEAADGEPWDLAFRRSNIRLNGGAGGDGMGAARPLVGATFDEVTSVPGTGWLEDAAGEENPDGSPVDNDGLDFVFARENAVSSNGWFHYDPSTHVLTPAEVVWAVRGGDGATYALEILDYYDMAGTSAVWSVRWKPVPVGDGPDTGLEVDASARGAWTYLSVADRSIVQVSDPASATSWDLAFSRVRIRTNSGASGPGLGGARALPMGASFAALAESPTSGFRVDAELPNPGPPGSGTSPGNPVLADWFDYDSATHAVSPKGDAYLVRTASGDYAKLQILEWEGGIFRLALEPVPPRPDIFELEIDASDRMQPAFVSLSEARVLTSTTDASWDVAFTRVRVQTNSGVSGPGMGGAVALDATEIEDVAELPAEGYAPDAMVDSGRPGVPPAPASPVLSDWYDYDPATRSVTPRPVVYGVRTADGHPAALQITSYEDGRFRVRAAFAGPGRSRLR